MKKVRRFKYKKILSEKIIKSIFIQVKEGTLEFLVVTVLAFLVNKASLYVSYEKFYNKKIIKLIKMYYYFRASPEQKEILVHLENRVIFLIFKLHYI